MGARLPRSTGAGGGPGGEGAGDEGGRGADRLPEPRLDALGRLAAPDPGWPGGTPHRSGAVRDLGTPPGGGRALPHRAAVPGLHRGTGREAAGADLGARNAPRRRGRGAVAGEEGFVGVKVGADPASPPDPLSILTDGEGELLEKRSPSPRVSVERGSGGEAAHDLESVLNASLIRGYVPHRQIFPAIAASISASVGRGVRASRAAALMICPGWQ